MKPKFVQKNLTVNELVKFQNPLTIYEFTSYYESQDPNRKDYLEFQIKHFDDLLQLCVSEINQVIHTSNSLAQTALFQELKKHISDWNLFEPELMKKEVLKDIAHWNLTNLDKFENEINECERLYFSKENVMKYKHLEQYEYTTIFDSIAGGKYKNVETNYRFYCIDQKPKIINSEYLDQYFEMLIGLNNKFQKAIQSELNLYDSGKLEKKESTTLLDVTLKKLKNNRFVVGVIVFMIILGGISALIPLYNTVVDIFKEPKEKSTSIKSKHDTTILNNIDEKSEDSIALKEAHNNYY